MGAFLLYDDESAVRLLLPRLNIPCGTRLIVPNRGQHKMTVAIPWGLRRGPEELGFTRMLNPARQVEKSRNRSWIKDTLERAGLSVLSENTDICGNGESFVWSRELRVPVFHLEALAVFADRKPAHLNLSLLNVAHSEEYEELPPDTSAIARRAARLAVRAVYALGLDFGIVTLVRLSDGKTVIKDVNPEPFLDRRLGELFAEAINRYHESLKSELSRGKEAILGADPEFVLVDGNGKVVPAARFFPMRGRLGCDSLRIGGGRLVYPLVELRPDPSPEPKQLILQMTWLMRKAADQIGEADLAWLAGGMPVKGFPLGGHIHLSRIWLNGFLLRALDNYLALSLAAIEDDSTAARRPRYGFPGDFLRKSHGGFEYRTPPSWLVASDIAKGALALSKIIAEHYWELNSRPLDLETVHEAYYRGNKFALLPIARKLWAEIESTASYAKYSSFLAPLKRRLETFQTWNEREDFRDSWHIPRITQPM
ncbi:putative amidoligase domain-containing protein [Ferviditalea candida]|uniref:PhiEco32-like amidoligase-type 2 protein n=1 Tax=Ferviditalea candida TaxID=3108399 RepID=A0ABU5ZJN9_9BACL|nr:hypothetical protein [Paenibacillaceae bacterium T2]